LADRSDNIVIVSFISRIHFPPLSKNAQARMGALSAKQQHRLYRWAHKHAHWHWQTRLGIGIVAVADVVLCICFFKRTVLAEGIFAAVGGSGAIVYLASREYFARIALCDLFSHRCRQCGCATRDANDRCPRCGAISTPERSEVDSNRPNTITLH